MEEELELQRKESEEKCKKYEQHLQQAQEELTQQAMEHREIEEQLKYNIKNVEAEKNLLRSELDKAAQDKQGVELEHEAEIKEMEEENQQKLQEAEEENWQKLQEAQFELKDEIETWQRKYAALEAKNTTLDEANKCLLLEREGRCVLETESEAIKSLQRENSLLRKELASHVSLNGPCACQLRS